MLTPHPHPTPHLISLSVPLDVRHASTVRVLASSVAADAGFDVDSIDDFRLGINEVVSVLADEPGPEEPGAEEPGKGRLTIELHVLPGRVEALLSRSDGAGATELDDLARRILDAVVDHHEYERGAFRLIKTATGREQLTDGD